MLWWISTKNIKHQTTVEIHGFSWFPVWKWYPHPWWIFHSSVLHLDFQLLLQQTFLGDQGATQLGIRSSEVSWRKVKGKATILFSVLAGLGIVKGFKRVQRRYIKSIAQNDTSPKKLVQPRKAPAHHQNGRVEPLPEGTDMIFTEQYPARRNW